MLVAVVFAIGIFFRGAHLGQKVYWHDEVFTSLRAAGHLGETVEQTLFTGEVFAPDQLLRYQRLSPDLGWAETLASLKTHPEHPPLYYLGTRLWMQLFGSDVATLRSLAALFGMLAIPALYWLCRELFIANLSGSVAGWATGLAIALFSLSPVHVLYAQEARQYSLWTLGMVLSWAALLRSLRCQRWRDWLLYGLTLILCVYTSLFSALVIAVQGLYLVSVLVAQWRRRSRNALHDFKLDALHTQVIPKWRSLLAFVGVNLLALLAFTPWLWVMVQNWASFKAKTQWTNQSPPLSYLMKLWGLHFSSGVIDPGLPLEHPYTYLVPPLVLGMLAVALIVSGQTAPARVWLLLVLLTIVPAALLIVPDLLVGGQRSASTRYFFPSLLGMILAIAYFLAVLIKQARPTLQRWGYGLTALLLTTGLISCILSYQANTWWSKGVSYGVPFVAEYLNDLPQPLVIVGYRGVNLGNSIALSYWLDDQVKLQLLREKRVPEKPDGVGDRFLFYPNDDWLATFEQHPDLEAVSVERDGVPLFRVQPRQSEDQIKELIGRQP